MAKRAAMNWKQGGYENPSDIGKDWILCPGKRRETISTQASSLPQTGHASSRGDPARPCGEVEVSVEPVPPSRKLTEFSAGHKHQDGDLFKWKKPPLAKSGTKVADTNIFRIYMYMDNLGQDRSFWDL